MNKKICIIRMGALGDVILTSPIVRAIHDHFAKDTNTCDITFVTNSGFVFDNSPFISKIATRCDAKSYDLLINLDLAYEKRPHTHTVDAYLEEAKLLIPDLCVKDRALELFTSSDDHDFVKNWISDNDINTDFVVLHMRRTGWESRNIPSSFWTQVVADILGKTNLSIVQIGLDSDIYFGGNERMKVLKNTSIQKIDELIKVSKAFIGVDTSTMHIGSTTDTPIISVFTSAHHEFRKPLRDDSKFFPIIPQNLDCYGCLKDIPAPATTLTCRRGDLACLTDVNPDHITQRLLAIV